MGNNFLRTSPEKSININRKVTPCAPVCIATNTIGRTVPTASVRLAAVPTMASRQETAVRQTIIMAVWKTCLSSTDNGEVFPNRTTQNTSASSEEIVPVYVMDNGGVTKRAMSPHKVKVPHANSARKILIVVLILIAARACL